MRLVSQTVFDPAAHPPLTDLGGRLRDLAGDAAYRAGRDYLRKGRVQEGAVSASAAHATVKGSSEYRVTVTFPSVEATKVRCTCPAHRRSAYCKHVVAVCAALLEEPAAFTVLEALPEPPASKKRAAPRRRGPSAAKVEPAEQRAAGLAVLDRLLVELTEGGLVQLGPEKAALIEQCAELVRALKLRRLGNLLMQLQRVVAARSTGHEIDGAAFARLLLDLYLCRAATGAQLDGKVALDARLAEDLLGKTWRAEELEPVTGLELVQVAATHETDGEFTIESSYLVDLGTLAVYVERQISPIKLRSTPKAQHRLRLLVEEAGLYPGLAPRRIRMGRYRRAVLRAEDADRLVLGATDDLAEVQRRLVERASVPLGRPEIAILFRPAMLLAPPDDGKAQPKSGRRTRPSIAASELGALDGTGRFVRVALPGGVIDAVATMAQSPGTFALIGLASLHESGLELRCLAVVVSSSCIAWTGSRGPFVSETS
jgi:hypothetical protein